MNEIFLKVLNMSIAASWLILAVMLLRFVLKRAPKWIAVALWGIVALRLAVPFSIESALSLIPSAETFRSYNIQYETPAISSGIPAINNAVNPVLGETFAPSPGGSVNPLYIWTFVVSAIWLIGIAAMLFYAVISYVRVWQSVAERIPYEGNIFLCDHVKSPFILGLIRPKIYLPSGMEAAAVEPVIAHEKAHLARYDHWWKPMGFLILAIHWFNPLCWIAYVLLCRDIELACDEKTIRQMDLAGKKQYSTALLECHAQRRLVTICPLAFGEVDVKKRVTHVLHYKKPAFWVIALAVIACAVVTVCFATNPRADVSGEQYMSGTDALREKYPEYFDLEASKGLEVYVWQMAENYYRFGLMQGTGREKTLEEKMALQGATAEEMALILSAFDVEDKDILVIPWQNPISSYMVTEDTMKDLKYVNSIRAMLGLDAIPADSAGGTDAPGTAGADAVAATLSEEQAALRQAILEHNRSANPINLISCASFAELACLSDTPLTGDSSQKITYYGWALYREYQVTDRGLETVSGSHTPVALSFDLDERGYTLTEYWEPRDGSYFVQDIREKFPSQIAGDGIDSQKFILRQMQECYTQAAASAGLDPSEVIGTLIETICSSPALSSNPADYIEEHFIEYRELIYYGRYTLKYCFDRFEKGGETGLEGQIMARVCEDITVSWGEDDLQLLGYETPEDGGNTGQMWYNALKNNAQNLRKQYSETELAEHYPASYLLLSMHADAEG